MHIKLAELLSRMTIKYFLSSVVWSLRVTPDKIDEMLERLYLVLEDHNYFERAEPIWFQHN